jgi:subtilisin family serine protease
VAILAAEVFHLGVDGRVRAIATDIAGALDWLAQQGVPVANISIAGPDSPLLSQAVGRLTARGTVLVAAAGNNGPAAPPAFPAGYESVIAVTAVDRHRRPYRLANRGPHLAFAAPGVEVWAAAGGDDGGTHTGTSFAAAYATAIIADAVADSGPAGRSRVEARLAATAVDLGAPGPDPVFGAGLVQAASACQD